MNESELKLILQEGEGYKIEFKQDIGGLDKEIVSFANASGGRIFVGVADGGKVVGLHVSNRLKSQVQDIANNCRPKPKILLEDVGQVLVVHVREGDDKPYECSAGFFKRLGPNSQKMRRDEIIDFFKSEGKIRFDELTETKFRYPRDFDKGKLARFLELAGLARSTKAETALLNLGVAERQEDRLWFNNAGVLFFAKEPQRFVPWSVYTVALFKDKDGVDVIDRKDVVGGLFEIVEQVMGFVRLYAKVAYRFTGEPQREEIYEYPFEAIREAVINSVMHKYYFEHGHNNILKFLPDRILIENYWEKPRHFVLGKTVFRRNHLIVDLFSRIHFGERMGTGFSRMRNICRAEDAPYPRIEYNQSYFYMTFTPSRGYLRIAGKDRAPGAPETGRVTERVGEKVGEKVGESLTANQQRIIDLVLREPAISAERLSALVGISRRKIEVNISKLKQKGLLRRIGPDKGGHWEVVEQ